MRPRISYGPSRAPEGSIDNLDGATCAAVDRFLARNNKSIWSYWIQIQCRAMRTTIVLIALLGIASTALAQDEPRRAPAAKKDGPWFGVMLPPKSNAAAAVNVGA